MFKLLICDHKKIATEKLFSKEKFTAIALLLNIDLKKASFDLVVFMRRENTEFEHGKQYG